MLDLSDLDFSRLQYRGAACKRCTWTSHALPFLGQQGQGEGAAACAAAAPSCHLSHQTAQRSRHPGHRQTPLEQGGLSPQLQLLSPPLWCPCTPATQACLQQGLQRIVTLSTGPLGRSMRCPGHHQTLLE